MRRNQGAHYATTRRGPQRVKFIKVEDGDVVSLGATMMPGEPYAVHYAEHVKERYPHTFLGFKPGTGPKAYGWIVVLVDETAVDSGKPVKHQQHQRRLRVAS